MTTAIEQRRPVEQTGGTLSTDLNDTLKLGEMLARSGFFSDSREAAQAVTKILAGRELGIPPVASMTGIYIVKGKVSLSSNLIAAQIKRSGKYDYRVTFDGNTGCTVEFFQDSKSVGTSAFTIQEANAAGLTNNETWKKFPRNMLFARALSNGARWYCPDVFSGPVYTPEELGLPVDAEGEVIEGTATVVQPEPTPIRVVESTTGEIIPAEQVALEKRFKKKAKELGLDADLGRQYLEEWTGKSNSKELTLEEWRTITPDIEAFSTLEQVKEWLAMQPAVKVDLDAAQQVDPEELDFDDPA